MDALTKRIIKSTKECGKLSPNDTLFYDIWFSGVKIEEVTITERVDYYGPVKKSQKLFFLDTLEKQ